MQRLSLAAAAALGGLIGDRQFEARRARLPLGRVAVADQLHRKREQAAQRAVRQAHRVRTAGDHLAIEDAARKRELKAKRRLREVATGGWGSAAAL